MNSYRSIKNLTIFHEKFFVGASYILLFISAYLLLMYFEEISFFRYLLLSVFCISFFTIALKFFISKLKKRNWFVFFVVILAIVTQLLNNIYYDVAVFYSNALFLIAATIVGYAVTNLDIPKQSFLIVTFFILFGLMFFILKYEITHGVGAISYLSNKNLLSMIAIPVLLIFFVQYEKNNMYSSNVLMMLVGIGLVVSIMSTGRSGIITSSIMFIGALIIKISRSKGKAFIHKLVGFFFMVIVLMTAISIFFLDYLQTKFSYLYVSGLTDPARSYIYQHYIESLTFRQFLSGTNYDEMPELVEFGGNLHSTYLTYHGNYGIFGIVIFLMFFLSMVKTAWNKDVFMTLVFLSFSLRIFTDTGNDFFTHVGVFTVIFYGLRKKQIVRRSLN